MATKDPLMLIELPTFKPILATKIPKRIGTVPDLLYKTKQTRLALQKVVDLLKVQEQTLKDYAINTIPKSKSTGVSGAIANIRIVPKTALRATDWEKVYKFIKANDAFEMLQKRLSDKACEERLDARGKRGLPGIEEYPYVDISLTKVS